MSKIKKKKHLWTKTRPRDSLFKEEVRGAREEIQGNDSSPDSHYQAAEEALDGGLPEEERDRRREISRLGERVNRRARDIDLDAVQENAHA